MPERSEDEKFMARALELASYGKGRVHPNPMVGSVIVCDGRIIGEGFHHTYGESHAEVNAIASVKDKLLLSRSTLYVNLEPCCHHGKTPPCADLIIAHKIPRVVIGAKDPFKEVSGRGICKLEEAGVQVVTGVLEKECLELNKVFMTSHRRKRPYIYLKWAQSNDGFMDTDRTDNSTPPCQFSTSVTRQEVHKLRSEVSAILVGTNTALLDNPSLTVREWSGNSPVRISIDKRRIIPAGSPLLDGTVKTLIYTLGVTKPGENREYISIKDEGLLLTQIMTDLYQRNLTSLLVEGGQKLVQSFLDEGVWDEIRMEVSPAVLGKGVAAPQIPEHAILATSERVVNLNDNEEEEQVIYYYRQNR